MKIIATICSKFKSEDTGSVPARKRYLGEHISNVAKIADDAGIPFFVLSGIYGLISGDEPVPYYDYLLKEDDTSKLAEYIVEQITDAGITEIEFYVKEKEAWQPYVHALETACQKTSVPITKHTIE